MSRSKIEWTDITINPVKGKCPVACPYCYARDMYDRFRWDPTIRWEPEALFDIETLRKPSKIFIGSTFELWHLCVDNEWLEYIFWMAWKHLEHVFQFLTKEPKRLLGWSPFPPNCWVGATATDRPAALIACRSLEKVEARVKFLSLEPVLDEIWLLPSTLLVSGIRWIIIGAMTGTAVHRLAAQYPALKRMRVDGQWTLQPPVEWVKEIVWIANRANVPVFIKNNLWPALPKTEDCFWACPDNRFPHILIPRQEYPV